MFVFGKPHEEDEEKLHVKFSESVSTVKIVGMFLEMSTWQIPILPLGKSGNDRGNCTVYAYNSCMYTHIHESCFQLWCRIIE